jgi:hypothetical protein
MAHHEWRSRFVVAMSTWCVLFVSGTRVGGTLGAPTLAETHFVNNDPGLDGLVPACLDGSVPRYWFQQGAPGATQWAVHMQGGGWCESVDDCARRAYNPSQCLIGSSSPLCFPPRGTPFHESMDLVRHPTPMMASLLAHSTVQVDSDTM